jgi:hypothetical protein
LGKALTAMLLITCTTHSFSIRLASNSLCVENFCHVDNNSAVVVRKTFTATITREEKIVYVCTSAASSGSRVGV